jgi:signal transduction histidine kinase
MRWWRRLSLRGRLTFVGTAGLAVGLAVGGLLIYVVLHYVLIRSVDSSGRQTASEVAQAIRGEKGTLTLPAPGTAYIQVVSADDQVLAASSERVDLQAPLLTPTDLTRAASGTVFVVPASRIDLTGDLRVLAKRVDSGRAGRIVVVASPTRAVEESAEKAGLVLLIAYPLLLAALAAFTWRVVGWALRPVEELRQGAELITASGRNVGRLPVPDADDEVNRLAVTLNDMLNRLDVARARQQAFVADAAHELRSPITSLRTQLEVADRLDEPALHADLLADVARLSRLVDDLLLLARADEGDPRLRVTELVDIAMLARAVVDAYGNGRVPVRYLGPEPPVWIAGDPVGLRRAVDNLVGNAVRYAASRVDVTITPEAADDGEAGTLTVTVRDDGPGIPAEDRERVFDRFTRLDNSRARADDDGAGLGLAIVRELVRLHQGTIALDDAEPGLRVDITLIAAPAPEAAAAPPRPADHDAVATPTR